MKRLIADSGSTKTDWVKSSGEAHTAVKSEIYTGLGLNPRLLQSSEIEAEMQVIRRIFGYDYDEIEFYGAGIGNPQMIKKIENCIDSVFNCPKIKVDSDMAGAARALLGDTPGVACIMGTGSNACHYNGKIIDRKTSSLGYILDDDGGGVAFGRRLLRDVYKNLAPHEIREAFFRRYNFTLDEVVENLYKKSFPNRWIAGFMPFIIEHKQHPYVSVLVDSQLNYYFDREFSAFTEDELTEEGIGFVGSVAYFLSDEIRTNLKLRGWKLRDILKKPLDKLI